MQSNDILRKYMDIVNEMNNVTEIYMMDKESKNEAQYVDRASGNQKCSNCTHFVPPNSCHTVEGTISPDGWCKYYEHGAIEEKWGEPTKVSPSEKGKYEGKTKAELLKSYNALKKSGTHHKGSPEYGRMRELAFAIRAKSGWGAVE